MVERTQIEATCLDGSLVRANQDMKRKKKKKEEKDYNILIFYQSMMLRCNAALGRDRKKERKEEIKTKKNKRKEETKKREKRKEETKKRRESSKTVR